jgi:O-methyltransferase
VSTRFTLLGRLVRAVLAPRGATIVHLHEPSARRDLEIVRETRARTELLVDDAAAFEILAYARAAARRGGSMAELGVFAGGTARLICEVKGDARLHLFDVFETLQSSAAPAEDARAAELRSRFAGWHSPRAVAERVLAPYPRVVLYPGFFPNTAAAVADERFSFVHIDADLESSTREALRFFYPRLVSGGIIIGDDYNLEEVRRAFDDFFRDRPDPVVALPWAQVVVVKTGTG